MNLRVRDKPTPENIKVDFEVKQDGVELLIYPVSDAGRQLMKIYKKGLIVKYIRRHYAGYDEFQSWCARHGVFTFQYTVDET